MVIYDQERGDVEKEAFKILDDWYMLLWSCIYLEMYLLEVWAYMTDCVVVLYKKFLPWFYLHFHVLEDNLFGLDDNPRDNPMSTNLNATSEIGYYETRIEDQQNHDQMRQKKSQRNKKSGRRMKESSHQAWERSKTWVDPQVPQLHMWPRATCPELRDTRLALSNPLLT